MFQYMRSEIFWKYILLDDGLSCDKEAIISIILEENSTK